MQLTKPAWHLFPGDAATALRLARKRFVTNAAEFEWMECDEPPADGEHWEAVSRALGSIGLVHPRDDDERVWVEEEMQQRRRAAEYACPVATRRGDHQLIALIPPPEERYGALWVAVYGAMDDDTPTAWAAPDSGALFVERVGPFDATLAAVWHVAAEALVPVSFVAFADIHRELLNCDGAGGFSDGSAWHEFHELKSFRDLPRDPEPYGLAKVLSGQSKLGGLPPAAGEIRRPPEGMEFAGALASDFFDVLWVAGRSLHLYLSPTGGAAFTA